MAGARQVFVCLWRDSEDTAAGVGDLLQQRGLVEGGGFLADADGVNAGLELLMDAAGEVEHLLWGAVAG